MKKELYTNQNAKTDYPFIDRARILGSIAVVAIHAAGTLATGTVKVGDINWFVMYSVIFLSIWAVPLFIMISGAIFLSRDYSHTTKSFYKRRLIKIGIPTVFWFLFYYLFYHFYRGDVISPLLFIKRFIVGPYDHLYFLPIILVLYLLTLLLKSLLSKGDMKRNIFILLLFLYISIFWRVTPLAVTMFIPYIGYYLAGYVLLHIKLKQIHLPYLRILFFVCFALLFTLNYFISLYHKNSFYLTDHMNPAIIMLTFSLFLLLKNKSLSFLFKNLAEEKVKNISGKTLGIYVVHPFLLGITLITLKTVFVEFTYNWYVALLFIPYLYIVSYMFTGLLQRIPYLNRLV